jgi:hypothetical protein
MPTTPHDDPGPSGRVTWLSQVRFGHEVAGRLTGPVLALLALLALAVLGLNSDVLVLAMCGVGAAVVFSFLRTTLRYARDDPSPGLVEGRDLVAYRHGELPAARRIVPASAAIAPTDAAPPANHPKE